MPTQTITGKRCGPLTKNEIATLIQLEDVIVTGERWQAEVAKALVKIRDEQLFRAEHRTFEGYARSRWGWEKSRAYQLCQFGEVLIRLSTIVENPPSREAHVRPLYGLDESDQIKVWRQVIQEYGPSPLSRQVEEVAARFQNPLSRSHPGVIPYCGSKAALVPQILSALPRHNLYIETHGGSAAVFVAKPPCRIEVLNDLDDALVCFFRVLRECPNELVRRLERTPFALSEWRSCRQQLDRRTADEIERARQFFVATCQSFAGYGEKFNRSTHRPHAKYWCARIDRLEAVATRLRSVVIECLDAVDCIQKYDRRNAIFFVDPPYTAEARSDLGPTYRMDMTTEDHERLLDTILHAKGERCLNPIYS